MVLGDILFRTRSYTPLPFIVAMLAIPYGWSQWAPARGDWRSAGIIIAAGLLVMAAGEALRVVAVAHASPATRTRIVGASRLFCRGPYAHVRNPLYIGNFLILAGTLIMAWSWFPWLAVIGVVSCCVQYALIVRLEEQALVRDLGDEYLEYKRLVPRFIPRFTPHRFGDDRVPDYARARQSERRTFTSEIILAGLILLRWYLVFRQG